MRTPIKKRIGQVVESFAKAVTLPDQGDTDFYRKMDKARGQQAYYKGSPSSDRTKNKVRIKMGSRDY